MGIVQLGAVQTVCSSHGCNTELPSLTRSICRDQWPLIVTRLHFFDRMFGLAGVMQERTAESAFRGVASLSRIAYFHLPEKNKGGATRKRAKLEVSQKVDGCCSSEYPFRLPAKRWIPEQDFGTAD